jgi:hypothetical protein
VRPSRLSNEIVPQGYAPLADVSERYGVSVSFLRRSVRNAELGAVTILGRIYVATDDLRERLAPRPYPTRPAA